ncbi:MAG TPA: SUMF1/EgtB/PvdO family nonheme iron enzyme [Vicinamibacterales bacterium]|nr:SUMF1/EgtB/PvdO family nonheme iron enzyme [Vicinamibacterales bacterium]
MTVSQLAPPVLDRSALVERYVRTRERTRQLFDLIDPAAYYSRPISLRNPIVFYEGHLPAFSIIAFINRGLGRPGVDDALERLFARGIDPESDATAVPRSGASTAWPSRETVLAFGRQADELVVAALRDAAFDPSRPAMRRYEAIFTALEHEAMHQETLLYMWHRLPGEQKRHVDAPQGVPRLLPDRAYETAGDPPRSSPVRIPAGAATLGADRDAGAFGWDNEFERAIVEVPAFEIDAHSVTNAEFLRFLEAGGYERRDFWTEDGWAWRSSESVEHPAFWVRKGERWFWRGMFEDIPLPASWPVYVSQAEAAAFARSRGRRLPTEAEFHRAAFGTPEGGEREFPWGSEPPDATRGNFDFASWEPVPAGSRPAGASAWGVHDLIGNGWEWTSTVFEPFPGFEPMASYPEYSADFFDGGHYVMKGASQATAKELVRRSFRNWFRPNYPYVYAKFRTAATE